MERKEGIKVVTGLMQILPIFSAVVHADSDYIFRDNAEEMRRLGREIINDLLMSDTKIAKVNRAAILEYAAEVGDYHTMTLALNLLESETSPYFRKKIVRSLAEYPPIDARWLPILERGAIDYLTAKPEYQDIAKELKTAFETIKAKAYSHET